MACSGVILEDRIGRQSLLRNGIMMHGGKEDR